MDTFEQPSSKLLYLVGQAYQNGILSAEDKNTIKDLIATQNGNLFKLLDQYPKENQQNELIAAMIEMVAVTIGGDITEPLNEASSPLDTMIMRKRKQQSQNGAKQMKLNLNMNQGH